MFYNIQEIFRTLLNVLDLSISSHTNVKAQVTQPTFQFALLVNKGIVFEEQLFNLNHIKRLFASCRCILLRELVKLLNRTERAYWNSFVAVVHGFLGNPKAKNNVKLVQILKKHYAKMVCRMSLKVHISDAHLDKFKENMGVYSE